MTMIIELGSVSRETKSNSTNPIFAQDQATVVQKISRPDLVGTPCTNAPTAEQDLVCAF